MFIDKDQSRRINTANALVQSINSLTDKLFTLSSFVSWDAFTASASSKIDNLRQLANEQLSIDGALDNAFKLAEKALAKSPDLEAATLLDRIPAEAGGNSPQDSLLWAITTFLGSAGEAAVAYHRGDMFYREAAGVTLYGASMAEQFSSEISALKEGTPPSRIFPVGSSAMINALTETTGALEKAIPAAGKILNAVYVREQLQQDAEAQAAVKVALSALSNVLDKFSEPELAREIRLLLSDTTFAADHTSAVNWYRTVQSDALERSASLRGKSPLKSNALEILSNIFSAAESLQGGSTKGISTLSRALNDIAYLEGFQQHFTADPRQNLADMFKQPADYAVVQEAINGQIEALKLLVRSHSS
ncbi:MAG: hypothetical protein D6719_08950 [Candidatus Dadabacteria bacterium]|nr:MAG: hypothetical protein D6719_08950 [Candidatus Dadabacteria bacterium]